MKERPILFSAPMVRAILEGRKTQTRRVVEFGAWLKPNVRAFMRETIEAAKSPEDMAMMANYIANAYKCRYGVPGDRLWVRETWAGLKYVDSRNCQRTECFYRADHGPNSLLPDVECDSRFSKWTPSIHMPRWASRITLEVVSVRVERLQEISDADAIAEGVQSVRDHYGDPSVPLMHCGTVAWQRYDGAACAAPSARLSYQSLWESINGDGAWALNPWVWVVEFKRLEAQ